MRYSDNIMAYLKWRGDLFVSVVPFNEVDALILTELSYAPFDGIVPGVREKGSVTVKEAADAFLAGPAAGMLESSDPLIREGPELLVRLADCPRFSQMRLNNYVNQIDYERVKQFSAVHIQVATGFTFIAFRGTDDEIVGWKENFNMSYLMPVPSQKTAVAYLNGTARTLFHKYWVGGHSKGGNLAIYASVFCEPSVQKRIRRIYSFDGPGFNERMVEHPSYQKIADLIISYVPQSSIVGMLLEHQDKYVVVKSAQKGAMQHDPISWLVNADSLERANERDEKSFFVDETLTAWLAKIDAKERHQFIEALFGVLDSAGIRYLSDLRNMTLKRILELIKAVSTIPTQDRDILIRIISMLWEESNRNRRRSRKSDTEITGSK